MVNPKNAYVKDLYDFIKDNHGTQPYLYFTQISKIQLMMTEFMAKHLLGGDIIELPHHNGIIYINRGNLPAHKVKSSFRRRKFYGYKYNHLETDGYFYRLTWIPEYKTPLKNVLSSVSSEGFRKKLANMIHNGKRYPYYSDINVRSIVKDSKKKTNKKAKYEIY